jgi:hypothetical protein
MTLASSIDLNGTGGNVLLVCYIVGGIALIVTSLLMGNSTVWKVLGTLIGAVLVVWAAYVLVFGGWIFLSFKVLLLPLIGIIRFAIARSRRNKGSPYTQAPGYAAPYTPPGTETWGNQQQPGGYAPPPQYNPPPQYGQGGWGAPPPQQQPPNNGWPS